MDSKKQQSIQDKVEALYDLLFYNRDYSKCWVPSYVARQRRIKKCGWTERSVAMLSAVLRILGYEVFDTVDPKNLSRLRKISKIDPINVIQMIQEARKLGLTVIDNAQVHAETPKQLCKRLGISDITLHRRLQEDVKPSCQIKRSGKSGRILSITSTPEFDKYLMHRRRRPSDV